MNYRFLLLLLIFLAPLISKANFSGIDYTANLHVNINKVCVNRLSRNITPGPYEIKINVFNAKFVTSNDGLFFMSQIKRQSIKTPTQLKFKDYQNGNKTSSSLLLNKLRAQMGGLSAEEYNFENFEFDIPFYDIERGLAKLPLPKNNVDDKEYHVMGIEIAVVNQWDQIKVSSSKFVFSNPNPLYADSLVDDLKKTEGSSTIRMSKVDRIWPKVGTLLSNTRNFYTRGNMQVANTDQSCKEDNYMSYGVNVQEASIATPAENKSTTAQ